MVFFGYCFVFCCVRVFTLSGLCHWNTFLWFLLEWWFPWHILSNTNTVKTVLTKSCFPYPYTWSMLPICKEVIVALYFCYFVCMFLSSYVLCFVCLFSLSGLSLDNILLFLLESWFPWLKIHFFTLMSDLSRVLKTGGCLPGAPLPCTQFYVFLVTWLYWFVPHMRLI